MSGVLFFWNIYKMMNDLPVFQTVRMVMKTLFQSILFLCLTIQLIAGCASPLMQAIERNDIDGTKELIKKGADVQQIRGACGRSYKADASYKCTPLMLAAENGNIEIMKMLLDKGVNINYQSIETIHMTAIIWAVWCSKIDSVKFLFDKGADISGVLGEAVNKNRFDIVEYLLDRGANPNDRWGTVSILDLAVVRGYADIAKILTKKGANIDKTIFHFEKLSLEYPDDSRVKTALTLAIELSGKKESTLQQVLANKIASPSSSQCKEIQSKVEIMRNELEEQRANPKMKRQIIAKAKAVKRLVEICKLDTDNKSKKSETKIVDDASVASATISDIEEIPSFKAKSNKNAYAIVIGIENYRQKLPRVDFAASDAKLVSDYLSKAMGYPEENIITLLNENASYVDLAKYLEQWLANNVEKGGTVFVYYSGHGAPNPKTGDAYLVPYDGDPVFIEKTGYSLKKMYEALGKLPAKEIIVALDSCFSGAGGRSVIAEGSRPLVMNLERSLTVSKNMTVMAAASGSQISSTYKEKGHGLFTYFLLKGIKNEDVIKQDGSIAIKDLFTYVKPQVERIARKQYNNEQTPQLIESK
jgi:ankyrin repeat protein